MLPRPSRGPQQHSDAAKISSNRARTAEVGSASQVRVRGRARALRRGPSARQGARFCGRRGEGLPAARRDEGFFALWDRRRGAAREAAGVPGRAAQEAEGREEVRALLATGVAAPRSVPGRPLRDSSRSRARVSSSSRFRGVPFDPRNDDACRRDASGPSGQSAKSRAVDGLWIGSALTGAGKTRRVFRGPPATNARWIQGPCEKLFLVSSWRRDEHLATRAARTGGWTFSPRKPTRRPR